MNKPCRHTEPKTGCRLCWLAMYDPRYIAKWSEEPAPTPAPRLVPAQAKGRVALPCIYRSEEPLLNGEAAKLGLTTGRDWFTCSKGHGKTRAGYICRCKGDVCGPKCPDYSAGGAATTNGESAGV